MATKVVMPKLGLVMKEGLVVLWHMEEGEEIEKGEVLLEIESDKVTTEVESSASGIVRKVIVEEGEIVPCGTTIAIIADADEEIPDIDQIIADTRAVVMTREEWEEKQSLTQASSEISEEAPRADVKASPAAKRLAKEHGVDLARVVGTGPDGRIVREDILKAAEEGPKESGPAFEIEGRPGKNVPIGKMRRAIGDNMARSAHTVARVVHFAEVDMTHAVEYRNENRESFKEDVGADLSYNAILVKATASAMQEDPVLNVSFQDNMIRKHADINIGLAVALDDGLITVSIKDADKKDLPTIAKDSAELIEKARSGKLQVDDVTGSSITISSLGGFDIDCFAPIVNLPEAAIIGVGSMVEKPVVRSGEITVAPIMKLSLSFDHRLIDGAPAARFLQLLKRKLEAMDI
jgi:pyruvate dehydrogenase E2 component (dihydrolipoamide acetyltransferase)